MRVTKLTISDCMLAVARVSVLCAYVARHDYILTLSKGSRSQLISERFTRMISARRSMSA
jgi:hypothetical protein